MADPAAADYGFSKTVRGQETILQVHASKDYLRTAKLRGCIVNLLLLFVAAIPGSVVGGGMNSGTAGVVATIAAFIGLKMAFKTLGKTLFKAMNLRTTDHTIAISPTTLHVNGRGYVLKDVRALRVGNSRDESTVLITKGTQAVAHDMMTKISYYIAFDYGAERVQAAFNLSEGQAHALLDEMRQTIASAGGQA